MTDLPNSASDGDASLITPGEGTDPTSTAADASASFEPGIDTVLVMPVAIDGESAVRPRRRRSLVFRFLAAFVVGFALMGSIGAGALYLWSREYDGRVLPGVSVGSSDIGGLTREQAASKIASDYASLGSGEITFNGPDGDMTTASASRGETLAVGDPLASEMTAPASLVTIDP